MKKIDYSIYVVTDRAWLNGKSLEVHVEQAILGGASIVQLREKNLRLDDFIITARKIKIVTDKYRIPLIINDNIEVALAVDAAGVHIGQGDFQAKEARKIIGRKKILGVSAANLKESLQAKKDGADYIGVGAIFPTDTKKDANYVSLHELKKIIKNVDIPVVVIGGINETNISKLSGISISGIALISAIFAAGDVKKAAENINQIYKQIRL